MHNMTRLKDISKHKKDINKQKIEEYQCQKDKVKDGKSWRSIKEISNQDKNLISDYKTQA